MKVVIFNIVVILSLLAMDICHSQPSAKLTCDDLPKVKVPGIEVFTANSPFRIEYCLTPLFECNTKVYTNPSRGANNYNGTLLTVKGSRVLAFDFTLGSDGKTINVIICNNGVKSVWYLTALEMNNKGVSYCLHTCNGTALAEFVCDSNNNEASPEIRKAIDLARQVPNGNRVHNDWQNCPGRHGCKLF